MLLSFADVIDRFGGPAGYAREVGMERGTAKQARRRNSISADWFSATARAAERKGFDDIDEAALAELAERRRTSPVAA